MVDVVFGECLLHGSEYGFLFLSVPHNGAARLGRIYNRILKVDLKSERVYDILLSATKEVPPYSQALHPYI